MTCRRSNRCVCACVCVYETYPPTPTTSPIQTRSQRSCMPLVILVVLPFDQTLPFPLSSNMHPYDSSMLCHQTLLTSLKGSCTSTRKEMPILVSPSKHVPWTLQHIAAYPTHPVQCSPPGKSKPRNRGCQMSSSSILAHGAVGGPGRGFFSFPCTSQQIVHRDPTPSATSGFRLTGTLLHIGGLVDHPSSRHPS